MEFQWQSLYWFSSHFVHTHRQNDFNNYWFLVCLNYENVILYAICCIVLCVNIRLLTFRISGCLTCRAIYNLSRLLNVLERFVQKKTAFLKLNKGVSLFFLFPPGMCLGSAWNYTATSLCPISPRFVTMSYTGMCYNLSYWVMLLSNPLHTYICKESETALCAYMHIYEYVCIYVHTDTHTHTHTHMDMVTANVL